MRRAEASSRLEEDAYRNVSLLQLKQDIYNDLSTLGPDELSKRSYSYWSRLESISTSSPKAIPH